jgi:hypothetical protein
MKVQWQANMNTMIEISERNRNLRDRDFIADD